MKTFTRWLLVLLLVAVPLMAVIQPASANTELVPGSRLVAPYWDISGSRNTLIFLTNVSKSVDLTAGATLPSLAGFVPYPRAVHVEFYDKTCTRKDVTIELSAGDIDQLDLKNQPNLTGDPSLPSGQGWVDIDVRKLDAQRDRDSLQCNVLLGTVVITDSASDFAIAYPAASSIGSSGREHEFPCYENVIVTHDSNGKAVNWFGRYEPFPSRVFVPFYFAEGGPPDLKSQLVIAAPADGNWFVGQVAGEGESPGQDLGTGSLMAGTALVYDGCENKESQSFSGHWLNGSLSGLFGPKMNQAFPPAGWKTPGSDCKATNNFPSADDDYSGAFVGWIDLPNTLADSSGTTAGAVTVPRGLVGLLIEWTTIGKKVGDGTRLWGDPADGDRDGQYSLVDEVDHEDLD
jgi:hypothetical protein